MTDVAGEFAAFLDDDELRVQRCSDCGRLRHVPRHLCPECHGDRFEWMRCSGDGVLTTWTTTVRPLSPLFTDVPFTVGIVTLAEGPRILGPILGTDAPSIGMRVRITIQHPADRAPVAAFVRVEAGPTDPTKTEDAP